MRRLRTRRSLLIFCIGLVVFAACLPAASTFFAAVLTPLWMVVTAVVAIVMRRAAADSDEQPVSLLSLLLSRAPPKPRLAR
jgi:hypothetical protein